MIWILLAALGLTLTVSSPAATGLSFEPITGPDDYKRRVSAEIKTAADTGRLKGMDPLLIYTHFDFETGGGRDAHGLVTLNATRNLGNRHKGLTWTGPTFFVSPADPDLRVYPSLAASIDDYVQLIADDGLYATAFQAARMGAAWEFFSALKHPDARRPNIGYDASNPNYDRDLLARYQTIKGEGVPV